MRFSIRGNIVDILQQQIFPGHVIVNDGRIAAIQRMATDADPDLPYILPGFIDAHVHIESSMLVPSEFARLAVVHGTVATVSDPHEIANVCGMEGVQFMIDNGKTVHFKFYFGAPSCVPATTFETAGDTLSSAEVEQLLGQKDIRYLSEMMNFPGVLSKDPEVMRKIAAAHKAGKPVDGHAPGLRKESLKEYADAGISTDHECFTEAEALEKLELGMKIIIREGSAARNFEALCGLLTQYPDQMMFCSDDKHPDSLVQGHINQLCARAVEKGIDIFTVLKAACVNPALHYRLDTGLLRVDDPADFIVVNNLKDFTVHQTFINGIRVAENGGTLLNSTSVQPVNRFSCNPVTPGELACPASIYLLDGKLPVIEALDGQLITNAVYSEPTLQNGDVVSDPEKDILKIVVVNRYKPATPAIGFIKNFGLQYGAIASSVAHDSHNIIATGVSDADIADAINMVITQQGGVCCTGGGKSSVLPLPVAGLMSTQDGYQVAAAYTAIDQMAKSLGSTLSAPFMTLSFMGLLVIPSLKLSDLGLFDGERFRFVYPR